MGRTEMLPLCRRPPRPACCRWRWFFVGRRALGAGHRAGGAGRGLVHGHQSTDLAGLAGRRRRPRTGRSGGQYREPRLVLFRGGTPTSCGQGQSAMGPFYCAADQKVYIDLDFYEVLRTRLGSPGDFAQAYVIAHEVGHHVQHLLGISQKLDEARGRVSPERYNALSVRLELQADCLAGVWAQHADQSRHILETGDIESAMNAAAHIGDDALQKAAGRAVVPESFTHGSSAQRQRWFATGLREGTVRACDTFNTRNL